MARKAGLYIILLCISILAPTGVFLCRIFRFYAYFCVLPDEDSGLTERLKN